MRDIPLGNSSAVTSIQWSSTSSHSTYCHQKNTNLETDTFSQSCSLPACPSADPQKAQMQVSASPFIWCLEKCINAIVIGIFSELQDPKEQTAWAQVFFWVHLHGILRFFTIISAEIEVQQDYRHYNVFIKFLMRRYTGIQWNWSCLYKSHILFL